MAIDRVEEHLHVAHGSRVGVTVGLVARLGDGLVELADLEHDRGKEFRSRREVLEDGRNGDLGLSRDLSVYGVSVFARV